MIIQLFIPQCLAEVVSKKGYVPLKEFAAIVGQSSQYTLELVRECLETKSCNNYLEPNREIREKEDANHVIHFLLAFTRIEDRNCVTEYGYVHYDTGTLLQSVQDFRNDNKLDPMF